MILIDTQALVWFVERSDYLGADAKSIIKDESAGGGIAIAPISVWEAAMLVDKERLVLSRPVAEWFETVLAMPGFDLADMTVAIGADAGSLPGDIHGDPADRILIATARSLGCPLLTADRKILAYAAAGYLQAIDARR